MPSTVFSSAGWADELAELRRRSVAAWDAASPEGWACLESAFVLLLERVSAVVAAGLGPLEVLSPEMAHFTTADEFSGYVDRYVWGRTMAVEDDWADMPRWRGWRLSSFERVPLGVVRLDSGADDPLDADYLPGDRPWPRLLVFVPPVALPRPALEVYQVLCADFPGELDVPARLRLAALASDV